MPSCPKPVKQKKTKKPKRKKSDESKLIEQIDQCDSDIVLLESGCVCILCGGLAKYNHHYFHKSNYGVLRFETNNHCPVCYGCHNFTIHTKGDIELLRDRLIAKIGFEEFDQMKIHGSIYLADRSMPYLREELQRKKAKLVEAANNADVNVPFLISEAAQKRIEKVRKELICPQ